MLIQEQWKLRIDLYIYYIKLRKSSNFLFLLLLPVGVTVDLEISPCAINAWLKLTFILCFICKIHTVNRVYQRYYTYHQRDDLEDFNHVFISLYK